MSRQEHRAEPKPTDLEGHPGTPRCRGHDRGKRLPLGRLVSTVGLDWKLWLSFLWAEKLPLFILIFKSVCEGVICCKRGYQKDHTKNDIFIWCDAENKTKM